MPRLLAAVAVRRIVVRRRRRTMIAMMMMTTTTTMMMRMIPTRTTLPMAHAFSRIQSPPSCRPQPIPSGTPHASPHRLWGTGGDAMFYDDFEGFGEESSNHRNDDDDDDHINVDALGDWRQVRRNLLLSKEDNNNNNNHGRVESSSHSLVVPTTRTDATLWAHETATPEIGGLVVRLPLEVELYHSAGHVAAARSLTKPRPWDDSTAGSSNHTNHTTKKDAPEELAVWYKRAQDLIQKEMQSIASSASKEGRLDASVLTPESLQVLNLYLEHQEAWQETCLVVGEELVTEDAAEAPSAAAAASSVSSSSSSTAVRRTISLVLNRPMALQLTDSLARLLLHGTARPSADTVDRRDFQKAFGRECAVYVGGPDDQHRPATLLHGYDLPGAVRVAPGVYRGGWSAAVAGVLDGRYQPLDFRFFVGRRVHDRLAWDVMRGRYQPVACAPAVALKQCIQLPKPLWHEVLELCGGQLKDISDLELLKRDDLTYEIVSEDEDEDDYDSEYVLLDEDVLDEVDDLLEEDEDEDGGFFTI